MYKKFINGLIFGAGFGIAFVIVGVIGFMYLLPITINNKHSNQTIDSSNKESFIVPPIEAPNKYLGSTNTYSGEVLDFDTGMLASGSGKIIGKAVVNGNPLRGLRLRFALNGKIYSQWATTDKTGTYEIGVPYGRYKITGFELDRNIANKILANKINHPLSYYSSSIFDVTSKHDGRGMTFKFVDPVIKTIKNMKYKTTEDVVLTWNEYPGATQYQVQIYEKSDPYTWKRKGVFERSDRAVVFDPVMNIKEHGITLKPEYYYAVEIYAKNDQNEILSKTASQSREYDFEVID